MNTMPVTREQFAERLRLEIERAQRQNLPHVEIKAGELHRSVGDYPGPDHRMPICCSVMREELKRGKADIVHEPDSGMGASLTIRYQLPRP